MSEPASARAAMSSSWVGVSRVVKFPDGKVFPEATYAIADVNEDNPMYLWLSVDDANSVTFNAMLTNAQAVELLHRTIDYVAVQRIKYLTYCLNQL